MLGLLRFVLAILVVVFHLGNKSYFSHLGIFSVFGFYVVSGYLMTEVLNATYNFKFVPFAVNRFLRLFPIYYIVAIITLFIIVLVPNASKFHPSWSVSYRLQDIVGNLLIFPFEFYNASFRLIPPTWSVAVELVNYFILWLCVARSRKLVILALIIAISYHIETFIEGAGWGKRYFTFYAALLPFSLGSCIYFFSHVLSTTSAIRLSALLSFSAWLLNLVLCGLFGRDYFDFFFYANLVSLVVFVYSITRPELSSLYKRSGKYLGDLAYPIFLTHWLVGYVMTLLIFQGKREGIILLAVSILPILGFSSVLSWMANKLFEPLRNQVRDKVGNTEFRRVVGTRLEYFR